MRMPTSPGAPAATRRQADEPPRPIAGGLKLPEQHVELIDQSHLRCVALGVSRIERPDLSPVGRPDLNVARDRNLRLYDHAAPVMELLYEQIVNSESMVVLTDATGTVLHSIGDDDFLGRASKVALAPGANWSEQAKGTNAVGTALIEEKPVLVHADEHYLHANHFLTCSAAPILDPRGNILGVLDVSGDHRSYHQHTMALVKMSARMIENRWLTDDYRNVMRLHFHSRVEFIGTLMEGILAISADGKIVGANRGALEQLGLSGAAIRMHTLTTLFGTTVGALVDRFRSPLATPVASHLSNGRQFHLLARFNWPVWTSLAEAIGGQGGQGAAAADAGSNAAPARAEAVARPGAPAAPAAGHVIGSSGSALAALRTGDAQIDSVVEKIRRVLDRDIPILILGETGTGKELMARAIHYASPRLTGPFVVENCAAIPDTLLESELFGHKRGAFTGAVDDHVGLFQRAHGGTVFLDEIGETSPAFQVKLLRVLQEGELRPVGSTRSIPVDVRVIAATHRDLEADVRSGRFREDLYYRIAGITLAMPPLRERPGDIVPIAERLLVDVATELALPAAAFDDDARAVLVSYPWPGNIRELRNEIARALALRDGPLLHAAAFSRKLLHGQAGAHAEGLNGHALPATGTLAERLDSIEAMVLRETLLRHRWNKTRAAQELGLSRVGLRAKLQRFGLEDVKDKS